MTRGISGCGKRADNRRRASRRSVAKVRHDLRGEQLHRAADLFCGRPPKFIQHSTWPTPRFFMSSMWRRDVEFLRPATVYSKEVELASSRDSSRRGSARCAACLRGRPISAFRPTCLWRSVSWTSYFVRGVSRRLHSLRGGTMPRVGRVVQRPLPARTLRDTAIARSGGHPGPLQTAHRPASPPSRKSV